MKYLHQKKIIVILILFTTHALILAQRGYFITGGIEINEAENRIKFSQEGTKLSNDWIYFQKKGNDHDADDTAMNYALGNNPKLSLSVNLNYLFLRHFFIAIGLRAFSESLVVHDNDFMIRNKIEGPIYQNPYCGTRAQLGNFNTKEIYINPSISCNYVFNKFGMAVGPYIGFGIGLNKLISNKAEVVSSYYHPDSHEFLQLKTNFLKNFNNQYLEIGYLICFKNHIYHNQDRHKVSSKATILSLAMRYSFVSNVIEADYFNSMNSKIQYTDHVTANNSNYSFVLKFGGGLLTDLVEKVHKNQYDKDIVVKTGEKVEPVIRKEIFYIPKKIRGRKISFKKEIVVKKSQVTIYVWDHGRYDKDIISVNLNGYWVLEDDTLTLAKKFITSTLREGLNYLSFFTISEGLQKPCTLSVIVDDGITRQQIYIDSDMNNSESIKIRFIP